MSRAFFKSDRTARLLKIQLILWQHPDGLSVADIAKKCNVSLKTAYRDLDTLESELGVPIWEEGTKRGITEGHFLPPITFSITDAINIFLATRSMQSYFSTISMSVVNTFMKLNVTLPSPLKQQIQDLIDTQETQTMNKRIFNNFNKLIHAWLTHHQAVIYYQELSGEEPIETVIDPYFFEPAWWGRSYFVIAYSHRQNILRSFCVDNILEEVYVSHNTYEIPPNFNAIEYLKYSWGAVVEGEIITVRLLFKPGISRAMVNMPFHLSQKVESIPDGSLILTLSIRNTVDFLQFVLSQGDSIEVLEPEGLRNQITEISKSILSTYSKPGDPPNDFEINEDQWKLIQPILPHCAAKGRHRLDERSIINGILWVLRTRRKWEEIPQKYGSRSTCNSRLKEWEKDGTWCKILSTLLFNPGRM